jgi:uncharacterized protein (DUF2236 family)
MFFVYEKPSSNFSSRQRLSARQSRIVDQSRRRARGIAGTGASARGRGRGATQPVSTKSVACGKFPAGFFYHAHDPELKLWVLATLIDSALLGYETFVAPLTLAEKQAYYGESLGVAHRLGIPREVTPKTYLEFAAYMESMLAGENLRVSEQAGQIVAALLASPLLRPPAKVARYFGVGLLPRRLREEYHFQWEASDEARLQRIAARLQKLRGSLPNALCINRNASAS